jgi:hypothetical protein
MAVAESPKARSSMKTSKSDLVTVNPSLTPPCLKAGLIRRMLLQLSCSATRENAVICKIGVNVRTIPFKKP